MWAVRITYSKRLAFTHTESEMPLCTSVICSFAQHTLRTYYWTISSNDYRPPPAAFATQHSIDTDSVCRTSVNQSRALVLYSTNWIYSLTLSPCTVHAHFRQCLHHILRPRYPNSLITFPRIHILCVFKFPSSFSVSREIATASLTLIIRNAASGEIGWNIFKRKVTSFDENKNTKTAQKQSRKSRDKVNTQRIARTKPRANMCKYERPKVCKQRK